VLLDGTINGEKGDGDAVLPRARYEYRDSRAVGQDELVQSSGFVTAAGKEGGVGGNENEV